MQVESRGNPRALSPKGAVGLMQVMPTTYASLAARYGLGADPWNLGDNILAGTAYLRELYDRYGASGFLAAYNAGPGRWEDHISGVRPLPAETVRYLARLGPVVGVTAATQRIVSSRAVPSSPFSAPIFVALNVPRMPAERVAGQARLLRIIAENATIADVGGEVFAARSRSSRASENTQADGHGRGMRDASKLAAVARPRADAASINSLFAPHNPR